MFRWVDCFLVVHSLQWGTYRFFFLLLLFCVFHHWKFLVLPNLHSSDLSPSVWIHTWYFLHPSMPLLPLLCVTSPKPPCMSVVSKPVVESIFCQYQHWRHPLLASVYSAIYHLLWHVPLLLTYFTHHLQSALPLPGIGGQEIIRRDLPRTIFCCICHRGDSFFS